MLIAMTLPILESKPVFRRNPQTLRLVPTRYRLAVIDGMARPVLLNHASQWLAETLPEAERKLWLVDGPRGIKPVPRGTLR